MALTGKLINPQIIYDEKGTPVYFDQTFIVSDEEGSEILREDVTFPYDTADSDVQAWVIAQTEVTADSLEDEAVSMSPDDVQWDWPEGIE